MQTPTTPAVGAPRAPDVANPSHDGHAMNRAHRRMVGDRVEFVLNISFWICVGCVPLAAGCGYLQTRPGHPDSWRNSYYDPHREWHPISATRTASAASGASASKAASAASAPPSASSTSIAAGAGGPTFLVARTPAEIWNARGYAYNLHLRYEAASFKAQDRQDQLAVPLLGAAIGTAAVALARANPYVLAGTALGGAAVGAGVTYLHPDKDAGTDLTADGALLCIVDQSGALNNMTAIPLVLDKAAIQDALAQLRADVAKLSTAASGAALASAASGVDASAENTIQQLDASIAQYVMLPTLIYQTADNVNLAARAGGARSLDYTSVLQSLQGAVASDSGKGQAQTQVQGAATAAASAAVAASAVLPLVTPASGVKAAPSLGAASAVVASVAAATSLPDQPASAPVAMPLDSTNKLDSLNSVLFSASFNDLARVTQLSKMALDDIPNPNFSTIAANIKTCGALK